MFKPRAVKQCVECGTRKANYADDNLCEDCYIEMLRYKIREEDVELQHS